MEGLRRQGSTGRSTIRSDDTDLKFVCKESSEDDSIGTQNVRLRRQGSIQGAKQEINIYASMHSQRHCRQHALQRHCRQHALTAALPPACSHIDACDH